MVWFAKSLACNMAFCALADHQRMAISTVVYAYSAFYLAVQSPSKRQLCKTSSESRWVGRHRNDT